MIHLFNPPCARYKKYNLLRRVWDTQGYNWYQNFNLFIFYNVFRNASFTIFLICLIRVTTRLPKKLSIRFEY